MCNRKKKRTGTPDGFTLIELLLVIALVGLLASLVFPAVETMRRRAENTACVSNLRQIGLAVMQKVQDNDNTYPYIEGNPSDPVYSPEDGALSMADALKPYGIIDKGLRCLTDVKKDNYFGSRGSSYEWFSFIDGERAASAKIYLPEGTLVLPLWRFPISADYELIHPGKHMNILFADGHVDSYSGPGVREDVRQEVLKANK